MSTDVLLAIGQEQDDDMARIEGRRAADAAIVAMARVAGAKVQERPIGPGYAATVTCAEPAAGIRFAAMLRECAGRKVAEYITRARQDAMTWQQVGQVLGLSDTAQRSGVSVAEAAFSYSVVAGHGGSGERLSFAWMCPVCAEVVVDRGPAGHPEDCEPGHAEGCGRLAAAVAAYQTGQPTARP